MSENKNKVVAIHHVTIGRTTLFKIVFPSLILLLFLPLIINWGLGLFDSGNRQIYSEYKNLYKLIIKTEGWFITTLMIQLIALICGILKFGPKASRQILENNKGLFITGFTTVLSLWLWMFISVVFTLSFFELLIYPKDSFIKSLASLVFLTVLYVLIPYLILAMSHSLLIGYFIGRKIKKLGDKPYPRLVFNR